MHNVDMDHTLFFPYLTIYWKSILYSLICNVTSYKSSFQIHMGLFLRYFYSHKFYVSYQIVELRKYLMEII